MGRYFQGYMSDARTLAGELGGTRTGTNLAGLLQGTTPQALHVALRAEAALRAGDLLGGASLGVTFLDVALLDAADASLRARPEQSCVNWERREIIRRLFRPTPAEAQAAGVLVRRDVGWLLRFGDPDVADWYGRYPAIRCPLLWQEFVLQRLMREMGSRPGLGEALDAYSEALHRETNTGNRPADFRNRIIHSLPTQREVELAVQLFETRQLWHRRRGGPRSFLHPEALAAAVLAGLGVTGGLELYEQLVADLCADVQDSPLE
jgi:hypothetical protein